MTLKPNSGPTKSEAKKLGTDVVVARKSMGGKGSKNRSKGQRTVQRVTEQPEGQRKSQSFKEETIGSKNPPPKDRRTGLSHIQSPVDASLMSAAPIINLFPVNHMLDSDQSS